MRVLLNRTVARFVKKVAISDRALCQAAAALLAGNFDVDLGGGVYKQRIARDGEGKAGGFRLVVVLRLDEIVFYIYGFAKKDRENVGLGELRQLKKLAGVLRGLEAETVEEEIRLGLLTEVHCNGTTVPE